MIVVLYYGFLLIGALASILFFIRYLESRQILQLVCALMWVLPAAYEVGVVKTCVGECNVRVDLLVIWPLELLILGAVSYLTWKQYRRWSAANQSDDLTRN